MDRIITHLTEIALLVPTQSISIDLIQVAYPDGMSAILSHVRAVSSLRVDLSLQQSKSVNLLLSIVRPCCLFGSLYITCFFQIVDWYLSSVRLFKDKIDEKDRMVAEKDRMVAEKDRMVAEKDRMVAEKDKRIAEKDEAIQRLEESSDIATALRETRRAETGRKWGK